MIFYLYCISHYFCYISSHYFCKMAVRNTTMVLVKEGNACVKKFEPAVCPCGHTHMRHILRPTGSKSHLCSLVVGLVWCEHCNIDGHTTATCKSLQKWCNKCQSGTHVQALCGNAQKWCVICGTTAHDSGDCLFQQDTPATKHKNTRKCRVCGCPDWDQKCANPSCLTHFD